MEGPHGELGSRLADGLGGNDTDGLAHLHPFEGGHVAAVALHADALLGFAGQTRADPDRFDARVVDSIDGFFVDNIVGFHENAVVEGVENIFQRRASYNFV